MTIGTFNELMRTFDNAIPTGQLDNMKPEKVLLGDGTTPANVEDSSLESEKFNGLFDSVEEAGTIGISAYKAILTDAANDFLIEEMTTKPVDTRTGYSGITGRLVDSLPKDDLTTILLNSLFIYQGLEPEKVTSLRNRVLYNSAVDHRLRPMIARLNFTGGAVEVTISDFDFAYDPVDTALSTLVVDYNIPVRFNTGAFTDLVGMELLDSNKNAIIKYDYPATKVLTGNTEYFINAVFNVSGVIEWQ